MMDRIAYSLLATLSFWVLAGSASAQGYCEHFDRGPGGWVASGRNSSWEWGLPRGAVIDSSRSRRSGWVTNLDGQYNDDELSFLTSPVIDLSRHVTDPELHFSISYDTEALVDETWVEVSLDNGPFLKLGTRQSGGTNWYNSSNDWWDGTSAGWLRASHPIPGAAGTQMRIRFVMSSNLTNTQEGVGIDDVEVRNTSPVHDVGIVSVDGPTSGDGLQLETVTVTLENFGSETQTSIPLRYAVAGGARDGQERPLFEAQTATEVWTGSLPAGARTTFAFARPVDLSRLGVYGIRVSTRLPADDNPCNDDASAVVGHVPTVAAFPYTQDFEAGRGGFFSTETGSSWERALPSGVRLVGAASGVRSWVTNADGTFADGESSHLLSPIFDFTAVAPGTIPVVQFSLQYYFPSGAGWLRLQYSVDGGAWQTLGKEQTGRNWYDDSLGWAEDFFASTWRTAWHEVPGVQGKRVQFRFELNGQSGRSSEGVAIDDFVVRLSQPTVVSSFPFSEDFEAGPGDFTPTGIDASWEWGVPAGAFITGAASGANAWVTNLTGRVNYPEQSALESPIFDLTAVAQPTRVVLEFSGIYKVDFGRAFVEIAYDGGDWETVGTIGTGVNWYTSFNSWWTSESRPSGEWFVASHELIDACGKRVQLRFRVGGVNSSSTEGFGLDDFVLKLVQPTLVDDFPHQVDFESDDGGFRSYGLLGSWGYGQPMGSVISSAASGSLAWVTNLGGAISSGELSYLESPLFDFTRLDAGAPAPLLQFSQLFDMRSARCWVEVSYDGGQWQVLGGSGQNWYGVPEYWQSQSQPVGQWRTASHPLADVHGKYVRIRFGFRSSSSADEGFGLDDFEVLCPSCPGDLYPGTREDLVLFSSINGALATQLELKAVQGGDRLDLTLRSPGYGFVGDPWAVVLTPFDFAGGISVAQVLPGFYANSVSVLSSPGFALPPSGLSLSLTWPSGGPPGAILAQGLVFAPGSANGVFASTDGHVFQQQ